MSIYTWGSNKNGELGSGELEDQLDPNVCELLKGKRIVHVACGEHHSLALTDHGALYAWGRGREGQLGNGTYTHKGTKPQRIGALRQERIVKAECGYYHCLAVTDTGRLFQWGKLYTEKQLGSAEEYFGISINLPGMHRELIAHSHRAYYAGDYKASQDMVESSQLTNFGSFVAYLQNTPELVDLGGKRVADVAGGYSFSVAVTEQGEVYAWGFNDKFQCGLGHRYQQGRPELVKFPEGVKIVKVACGQQHSLALSSDGRVFAWGLGVFGQLGNGSTRDLQRPKQIEGPLSSSRVIGIACGSHHSLCVTEAGEVWTWGSSEYGQQGGAVANYSDWASGERGHSLHNTIPRKFEGLQQRIVRVACGHLFNIAVSQEGDIFTWGWGATGALGHGNRRFQLMPVQILRLKGEPIQYVAAGSKHAIAVTRGSTSTFAFDFKPFVNNKAFFDIIFRVEGKPILAHKCIVFSRCPLLKTQFAMSSRFTTNIQELEVKAKYPVFLAMIYYLYTDHVKIPPHLMGELLLLAKRYKLHRLAQMAGDRTNALKPGDEITPSHFKEDLITAINDPSFADIKFRLDDKSLIHAHKMILAARCDYFKTIFDSGFIEHEQKEIALPGIDAPTFLAVLQYIYTGDESVVQNEDRIIDILIAADRFLLDDLKQITEAEMEHSLDIENCSLLLELGDRHNAPRLKRVCLETIVTQWESLKATKGFQLFLTNPSLVPLIREVDYLCHQKNLTTKPGEVIRMVQQMPSDKPAPQVH